MEKLKVHSNGQWSLEKSISKRYHVEPEKVGTSASTYSVKHPEHGHVADAVVDHSTGKVESKIDPKFSHHSDHINRSIKLRHAVQNTSYNPKLDN